MKFRTNSKTSEQVSLLGFGMMRLPIIDGDHKNIDEERATKMVRYAIDNGVNYIDTAYVYHGGQSEVFTGKVLKDGYREKVNVATKLPYFMAKEPADLEKFLDEQLARLDMDYIDYYLVHDINDGGYEKVKKLGIYDFMKRMKEAGKIRKMGFSFHGTSTEFFKQVVDDTDWDFCQIQLNYMDTEIQAGVAGLKYAASKGLPVIIMEPLKGGKITNNVPEQIQALWKKASSERTPAEWALRWVADFPEVLTILSGMGTMEQVEENVRILGAAEAGSLSADELAIIGEVADEYNKLITYGCTACRYCLPCPVELDIPGIIGLRNDATMYDCVESTAGFVKALINPKPSTCVACKKCEEICPQHLAVADIMAECAQMFEG
ncbi:MAG: aldo/keto reductase [Clostridiales Family XIII bacterium]|jgi:predicted aldo/keto reductase-like oxidoreductase|nr:aldo/keto reductase [Clostridiales Family XIII bacterium]